MITKQLLTRGLRHKHISRAQRSLSNYEPGREALSITKNHSRTTGFTILHLFLVFPLHLCLQWLLCYASLELTKSCPYRSCGCTLKCSYWRSHEPVLIWPRQVSPNRQYHTDTPTNWGRPMSVEPSPAPVPRVNVHYSQFFSLFNSTTQPFYTFHKRLSIKVMCGGHIAGVSTIKHSKQ